jgi:hypothetical protein
VAPPKFWANVVRTKFQEEAQFRFGGTSKRLYCEAIQEEAQFRFGGTSKLLHPETFSYIINFQTTHSA